MTHEEERKERLTLALLAVEEALGYFDDDEAFALYAKFEADLWRVINE